MLCTSLQPRFSGERAQFPNRGHRSKKQWTLRKVRPPSVNRAFTNWLECNPRKDARSLLADCIQGCRIDAQGFENGRRHLRSTHCSTHRAGFEPRNRQQQNDVRVVMGEATVLGLFRVAAGVSNTDVRGHDDVRRAGVVGWIVVVKEERRPVINLPERDPSWRSIRFEYPDCGSSIERAA